jgi:putative Holliday junction resolvase
MKYLAVDYGTRRTGLAVCDKAEMLASPLVVIDQPGNVIPKILETIRIYEIESIVIGLPYNMDGTEGSAARATRAFAAQLEKQVKIPILFHDERLSSFEAEEKLAAAEFTRKKFKKRLDAVAAAAILQSFLDNKHQQERSQS